MIKIEPQKSSNHDQASSETSSRRNCDIWVNPATKKTYYEEYIFEKACAIARYIVSYDHLDYCNVFSLHQNGVLKLHFNNIEQKQFFKTRHFSSFSCRKWNHIFSNFVQFSRFWFTFRLRSPIFSYIRHSVNDAKSSHLQNDVIQWAFTLQFKLIHILIRIMGF